MSNTSLISTVYSTRLLNEFQKNLVFGGLVSQNWSGDAVNNKVVKINTIGTPTVKTYTAETDLILNVVTASSQDLTIDQYSYFAEEVDALISGQSVINNQIMVQVVDKGAYALANAVDTYIASTLATGASATNLIASASISSSTDAYDYIVAMGVKLDEANAPANGRFVVVPSSFKGLLQKDSRATLVTNVLTSGQIPIVNGMQVLVSNNLSKTGNYTNVIAGVQEASAFAYGLKDFSIFTPQLRFGQAVKQLLVYGAKVVTPLGLVKFPVIVS